MMGPLSGPGLGCTGIAVWTSPLGVAEEWVGIRVCIEAGSEWSDVEGVVEDEEVCVGLVDDDDNDDDCCWRFTTRRRCTWDATPAKWKESEMRTSSASIVVVMLVVTD